MKLRFEKSNSYPSGDWMVKWNLSEVQGKKKMQRDYENTKSAFESEVLKR